MKVIIKNLQEKIPVNPKRIRKTALKVLSLEGIKKPGEISILFVNDRQIKEFNLLYRGRDCPTDVLSFDSSINKKEILADIVVSTETAVRQSRIFKTAPIYEVYLYVIHGVLHLLGYDDKTAKQRNLMQKKAEAILSLILNTQYALRNKNVYPQNRSNSLK